MNRTVDIAWCAGLFEGEGCIIYGASHKGAFRLKISSTDRDVLETMLARSGVGYICGPTAPRADGLGKKPFFTWIANGHAAVALLREMLPFLGERRTATANEKLGLWAARPVRKLADKVAIRADRAAGMRYVDIAAKHGVSHARIWQICRDGQRMPRRWAVAPAE